jgi:uncharacterized membrane protein (GlpM family)
MEEVEVTLLSIKALLGAAVVIIISLAAHMKNYYLAGLVPLQLGSLILQSLKTVVARCRNLKIVKR